MTLSPHLMIRPGLAALLCLSALGAAHADGGRAMPRDMPKAYIAECAACHTAYTPGLLPARSWQRIMTGLDKHYGTDASLDEATVRQLSTWLLANAGTYKRVTEEPPQDRITRSAWFARKHRGIDDPAVWKLASVKSAANCAACHTRADQGDFDDDNIRYPEGMPWRFRLSFHD
ncbi:diheme cytochrome c [Hydrogenophaga sp.]|uniref:diheme cytochrome c n=1 Tax=Hydrogenophaga sp. TaxID=1904254 RepID=UPI0035B0BBA0